MNLSELIWSRGSVREIMRGARKQFHLTQKDDLPGAYIALASVHYSLVKRYKGLLLTLAVWHMWRAVWNVKTAFAVSSGSMRNFNADQIDVVTKILAKAPAWIGGDRVCAISLLNSVLYLNPYAVAVMKPHTRALMLITLGEIEWQVGKLDNSRVRFSEARKLIPAIESEDSADREMQLVRVMSAVGFFYLDHAGVSEKYWSEKLLERALDLARKVSKDQEKKILAEWKKRGR